MTRTLFVGDLHAKADLLPLITRVARREHAERIVLLGDICDDWNVSNNGLVRFFDTFAAWYRLDVLPVLKHRDSNTCCYRVEVSHVMAEASFPR